MATWKQEHPDLTIGAGRQAIDQLLRAEQRRDHNILFAAVLRCSREAPRRVQCFVHTQETCQSPPNINGDPCINEGYYDVVALLRSGPVRVVVRDSAYECRRHPDHLCTWAEIGT